MGKRGQYVVDKITLTTRCRNLKLKFIFMKIALVIDTALKTALLQHIVHKSVQ